MFSDQKKTPDNSLPAILLKENDPKSSGGEKNYRQG